MKRIGLILASALLLASAVVTAGTAADDPLRPKVDALVNGSYSKKARAVLALAATGDHRAVDILNAYMSRKLYRRDSDKRALLLTEDGDPMVFTDPLDHKVVIKLKSDAVTKARINNRVRGAIGDALATLNLFAKDPDVRRRAADEAFKVRSPRFGPLLRKALEAEKIKDIRARIKLALAAVLIANGSDTKERVAAIETLSDESSPEVVALLRPLTTKNAKGEWAEKDAKVRAAAMRVLSDVQERLALLSFLGDLYRGISLGSVLLLAAIGLAITFGVMGVINMAHGEMVMLGAYTTFAVQEVFRASFPEYFDWSVIVAIPLAFMVAGAVGIAIERGIIQFLYGRPLETLLATWGVSLVLQQAVRSIFGAQNREVGNPSWMSGGVEVVGGVTLTYNRLWIIVFALLVFAILQLVIRHSSLGLKMRAVTQNRQMASAMGIRNGWVNAMTFGLGTGIAGIGGVALSQITNVSPNLGQGYIVDSFMVVVFGGVGNLWGTLVGALSLGVVNKFLEPYAGAVLGKILVLVFIILFIQRRPRGLFALKGRAADL